MGGGDFGSYNVVYNIVVMKGEKVAFDDDVKWR